MARFSDIAKGRRARKAVVLMLGDRAVDVDVRVLGADEDIDIAADSVKFAKSKGIESPAPGDEVYDRAERALTLLRACVDHESPEEAPVPFFASLDEILTSPDLARDHIAYLVEEQVRWQEECSPRRRTLSTAEYIVAVAKSAEGDMGPFVNMVPGLLWGFVHTMALQLIDSQTDRSLFTSQSQERLS